MEQLMQYETLNFSEALNKATNRIFQITGRSRRSEYWWTMFVVLIISMAVPAATLILELLTVPLTFRRLHDTGRSGWWWGIRFIGYFVFICLFIGDIINLLTDPDMDLLYNFLFKQILWMVGFSIYHIIIIIILCLDGDKETNEYGESEKYFIEETD